MPHDTSAFVSTMADTDDAAHDTSAFASTMAEHANAHEDCACRMVKAVSWALRGGIQVSCVDAPRNPITPGASRDRGGGGSERWYISVSNGWRAGGGEVHSACVVLGRVPGSSALSGCRQAGVTGVLGVVRLSTGVARLSTAVPTVTTSRRMSGSRWWSCAFEQPRVPAQVTGPSIINAR